jgi:hypothetical protein
MNKTAEIDEQQANRKKKKETWPVQMQTNETSQLRQWVTRRRGLEMRTTNREKGKGKITDTSSVSERKACGNKSFVS